MHNWIDKAFDIFDIKLTFKKRIAVILGILLVVSGIGYLYIQEKYTTFTEYSSSLINNESEIQRITISIKDTSGDSFPVLKSKATIEDEKIMEDLLSDFSKIEMIKDRDDAGWYEKYYVDILTTIENEDGILRTQSFVFDLGETYLDGYKITSETDHLQTIEALVENEDIEWEER
ncbi:hypothetical protein [Fredinandcohnia sp. 179-A 10B2 NHS]|uniref:hypothetical protein n=1 Tax=Fredinandcohnia sp. 179-A 10B2 NHS TaxID=3235176 RepID=UPI0039A14BA7